MLTTVWDTQQPGEPGFLGRWTELLSRCPQANFGMDARYLQWEAARGQHALAVIAEEGGRVGALVLRRSGRDLVCGQPWRWHAALAGPPAAEAVVPSEVTCAWFFAAASAVARGRRVSVFLPARPGGGVPGHHAGGTLLVDLAQDDEKLLAGMDTNKRRAIKKAVKEGWSVVRAEDPRRQEFFVGLQHEANTWRQAGDAPASAAAHPAPGESWREWELPWTMLLLAEREGEIGAGSGFGWLPGGMIDYRTNASTAPARKAGCNAQLAFEAMRMARAQGCRVMNWGGLTEFKREMGGERATIYRWLGGGIAWALPNRLDAGLRNGRQALAAWVKTMRKASPAKD